GHVFRLLSVRFGADEGSGGIFKLAHALFISPGYLSSVFSKYEPMGVANYINKVKITEAQQLLRKQRLKVYEVAFRLGYENAGYFAKVFKKYTGYTPKEYMERK
ncbi:MAG TPA: helix-turn-helix transcriptional regulator, partial [Candidatus Blautia pullicola]|nr:helix-turn-helix transcriptional regulator [Candidatus Blautia pullicola]